MDTSDEEITFDEVGNCNHCNEFLELKLKWTYQGVASDKLLEQQIQKIKLAGKNNKYDCVVGMSGGADSCYTAYICKNAGLRVLLVHLDNGWDSETSVKNIETISKKLGLDYVSHVLDWNEFRDVQLAHLKASVPEIETPTDIAILEHLHKTAANYGIKHVIMGGNYITEGILPKNWHYNAKDKKYSLALQKQFGTIKIKNYPSFSFWEELYYKFFKGIRIFYILNYVPYIKKEAIAKLEEMGWKDYGQKHHESFYTRIVQSYILPVKFNIDYRKATYSNKICTGDLSREDALTLLSESPYNQSTIESDIEYVCKKLGITVGEFDEIMRQAPKTYKDYPNSSLLLEFTYRLYRHLFNMEPIPTIENRKEQKVITPVKFKNFNNPTISVIVPTYNRAEWITKTIHSILNQTYQHLEIIVVDDGSKDNTEDVVKAIVDSRIRYFKTINQERGAARNFGQSKSVGDYVVYIDSDDIMYSHCLELAVNYIQKNQQPEIFHVAHEIRDQDNHLIETTIQFDSFNTHLIRGNPLACMNVFIRKDISSNYLFNENRLMAGFEDWELWLRLAANYPINQVKVISGLMLDHSGRSSNNHTNETKLVMGIELLMEAVLNNKEVANYYRGKLNLFKCGCYTYIALHLAINSGNKKNAINYLKKGILQNPWFIFEKRFAAIVKYLVLR
jgi:N-acetyl sugar amidotransferase